MAAMREAGERFAMDEARAGLIGAIIPIVTTRAPDSSRPLLLARIARSKAEAANVG
jgi:hypothetical protein